MATVDEEKTSVALAEFGVPPEGILECPRYTLRVIQKRAELRGQGKQLGKMLSKQRGNLDRAMSEHGRALAAGSREKLEPLTKLLAAVDEAQSLVTSVNSNREAKERELRLRVETIDGEIRKLNAQLEPYRSAVVKQRSRMQVAEAEVQRAEKLLERSEMEIKTINNTDSPNPQRIAAMNLARSERDELHKKARAAAKGVHANLASAERQLDKRMGGIQNLQEQRERCVAKTSDATNDLASDESTATGALNQAQRLLSAAARERGLGGTAGDENMEVSTAQQEAARTAARMEVYERATQYYDTEAYARGWVVMMFGATALLLGYLFLMVR